MSFDLEQHVHRLARALMQTEIHGIRIDLEYATKLGLELTTSIARLEHEMRECVGAECQLIETDLWLQQLEQRKTKKGKARVGQPIFNFSSNKQLGALLFEYLYLPGNRTKKGAWRTDAPSLEKIHDRHPVVSKILECNKLNTYNGTFVQGVLARAIKERIYPAFNVNGTTTGRISHSNPNMGNMPARGEWAKIRGVFLPDFGECIAKADYSQLEVCVAAHYSQDPNLLKIIRDGVSQHDITADALKIERATAKILNFAMQYRCSAYKVAQILNCSNHDAQYAWNRYWELYAGQKRVMDALDKQVDAGNPVVSIFGRRRHFEKRGRQLWDKDYRRAYSALIQGTGGDLMNLAFYETYEELQQLGIGRTGWTVHDEGILFPKIEYNQDCLDVLIKHMVNSGKIIGLSVPLTVESEGNMPRWKK